MATDNRFTDAPSGSGPVPPWLSGIRDLHPAYFSQVMATGIVSISAHLTGFTAIAMWLLVLNVGVYFILLALLLARIAAYPRAVWTDLRSHSRSVGFFTLIAGTCVLGSQSLVVGGQESAALALWVLGFVLWAVLIYGIFTVLTVLPEKPTLDEGINGAWLVAVVAAQSVAVLGVQVSGRFQSPEPILFLCLAMWLGGGMLYVWMISLIFYRYTFFPMKPADLAPPYWINMGAAAISTLAGAQLIAHSAASPILATLLPFLQGVTIAFWAIATWWIPMLATLGAWRHLYSGFPFRYDPLYWGAVFPIGMYTASTYRLAETLDAEFLGLIPRYFIYVAFLAWTIVFIGLLRSLSRWASHFRGARKE